MTDLNVNQQSSMNMPSEMDDPKTMTFITVTSDIGAIQKGECLDTIAPRYFTDKSFRASSPSPSNTSGQSSMDSPSNISDNLDGTPGISDDKYRPRPLLPGKIKRAATVAFTPTQVPAKNPDRHNSNTGPEKQSLDLLPLWKDERLDPFGLSHRRRSSAPAVIGDLQSRHVSISVLPYSVNIPVRRTAGRRAEKANDDRDDGSITGAETTTIGWSTMTNLSSDGSGSGNSKRDNGLDDEGEAGETLITFKLQKPSVHVSRKCNGDTGEEIDVWALLPDVELWSRDVGSSEHGSPED
jgi:hypothetical protein